MFEFSNFWVAVLLTSFAGLSTGIGSLLPSAEKYGNHHLSILGLVIGMMVMACSLLLF